MGVKKLIDSMLGSAYAVAVDPEVESLRRRVEALESERSEMSAAIDRLTEATHTLMEGYVTLSRDVVVHRQAIADLFEFLASDANGSSPDELPPVEEPSERDRKLN